MNPTASLHQDVVRVVHRDYPNDTEAVFEALRRYGAQTWHREVRRVHLAILNLAGGDPARVGEYTQVACFDYRDVLDPRLASQLEESNSRLTSELQPLRSRFHVGLGTLLALSLGIVGGVLGAAAQVVSSDLRRYYFPDTFQERAFWQHGAVQGSVIGLMLGSCCWAYVGGLGIAERG